MPKTIQIRDVPDEDYRLLLQRAAERGLSVPEWLRQEIKALVEKPSMKAWLERVSSQPPNTSPSNVNDILDELRGPWPGEEPELREGR